LLEIGLRALPELRTGTANPDAEVASRCVELTKQIRAAEREAIISGKKNMPGEAGKRFKELVGDSKGSRTLFADMLENERRAAVAELVAADPAKATVFYRAEVAYVDQTWKKRFAELDGQAAKPQTKMKLRMASQETVPPGEVVLVFLLGSYPLPAGENDVADVESVLKASFIDLATLGGFAEPFRKLFVVWLEQRRDQNAVKAGLYGALFGVIPEAAPVARRVLADKKSETSLADTAALVLGNLGSVDDLSLLEALRDDTRTYASVAATKVGEETVKVQVRDQATAMSLQLRKAQSFTYGFNFTQPSAWWAAQYGRPFKTVQHFDSDKEREAAHKKAWSWLDRQPKASGMAPEKK
jgi:hypothetical protein